MGANYEVISDRAFYEYEKLFFEEICLLDTEGRDSFDTALPAPLNRIHFACVQDTVERLTEITGLTSKFQWRNCLFVPIDRNIRPNDIYKEVYEELRTRHPSLFIRSYVYVIFIKVYGGGALDFSDSVNKAPVSKNDMQIYAWNSKYEIKLQGKVDLFNLKSSKKKDAREAEYDPTPNKVFIVKRPDKELQRIQDANSDVIDAVKAFYGDLGLVEQTEKHLRRAEKAFCQPGSRVLMEGPARSGKTIVAMSLLASNPNAKMILMNWYFYDALKDAFKVWAHLDKNQIAALFETDLKTTNMLAMKDIDADLLRTREKHENILIDLAELWANQAEGKNVTDGISRFRKVTVGNDNQSDIYLATNPKRKKPGELILIEKFDGSIQARIVEKSLPGDPENLVRTGFITHIKNKYENIFTGWRKDCPISIEGARKRSKHLTELEKRVSSSAAAALAAEKLKEIADALDSTEQRFFHHDRRPEYRDKGGFHYFIKDPSIGAPSYGHWEYRISDGCALVCDEAQRLWDDEVEWIARRPGATFLCGDDNQRLNPRGDKGMERIRATPCLERFELPDTVGIPAEIGVLIEAMLGEAPTPKAPNSYSIKLIHGDDLALVAQFEKDPSAKKHYAIPVSTGFLPNDYVPAIMKADGPTKDCDDECGEKHDGYCLHRYIRMISPLSDPKELQKKEESGSRDSTRKDLSREYKFFCAEAIMPNYALSAYELISREVESIYLKIPAVFGKEVLEAPIGGAHRNSWIKRHLYVLMTRATANLVINVEDEFLYSYFRRICQKAGLNCDIE